jgi:hypothetical protein
MARNSDGYALPISRREVSTQRRMAALATNARQEPTLEKLDALRAELADLAFKLESRGRLDAADLAMSVATRVGELCEELAPSDGS